jgi:hypothetical protein
MLGQPDRLQPTPMGPLPPLAYPGSVGAAYLPGGTSMDAVSGRSTGTDGEPLVWSSGAQIGRLAPQ